MLEGISPFQQSVLQAPEAVNLALLGARGGGKTTAAVMLAAEHLKDYGTAASVLIVRRTLRALSDFEDELLHLVTTGYSGGSHVYNRAEKILRWNGGTITMAAIERTGDYDKLQGKNFTLLIVEEVTQYPSEKVLRLLRSNLRAPEGVPTRVVYLGNPGGPLHGRIFERHIRDRCDHSTYDLPVDGTEEAETWITIKSGPADNPFINQQAYIRRLREACHGDPVRLQQWLFGDWTRGEGLMFPAFEPDIHVLSGLPIMNGNNFRAVGAIDWGISSPSVALIGGVAKRPIALSRSQIAPRDSVVIWDETTDAIFGGDTLNSSSEWPPDRLAERFANTCANHGIHRPSIVVDSARGLQGDTVIGLVRGTGQFWNVALPKKGRRAEGWADVNSRLLATKERDSSRPHLYVSDRCLYLLATLPNAVRDERDPDDWADTPVCPDHGGDALRYLLAEARLQPARFTPSLGIC
ncbi:phage terminase, large subunit, PBSX family [Roseibium album]|nr:phage terminase, large subunit, PBSX family [Roseibium album]